MNIRIKLKEFISSYNAIAVSSLALIISALTYYDSLKPKDTKITIKTSEYKKCFNNEVYCNQLFLYINDEAPCFDFHLSYNVDEFNEVSYQKDFEKSRIMDSSVMDNGILAFPFNHKHNQ